MQAHLRRLDSLASSARPDTFIEANAMKHLRILILLLACAAAASFGGCAKPPRNMPDASIIGFDGKNAVPPECTELARESLLTDAGVHRPDMQWGCATYTNLAAQVANPRDLVAPAKLAPADGAVAVGAMQRYESGKVIPLDATSSRSAK
jgi:type IV pilus biogenesis protein CpaD/CtpE